jgi:cob(I)alamin adenosyltransferase
MEKMKQGFVQIYTGNGKGKTTAALGLAVRALGAGMNVLFIQFLKGMNTSELEVLSRLGKSMTVRRYGADRFIMAAPAPDDFREAREGLADAVRSMNSGAFDMIVLDEVLVAVRLGLLNAGEVVDMVKAKPAPVELILTGRDAPKELLDVADLVTEMREVKHYFTRGVPARKGIEL